MSTKLLVSIVVGVVVIGGVIFMVGGRSKETTSNEQTAGTTEQQTTQSTSLKALLASGSAQKCTFSEVVENSESTGVVYVAQGKMRGDFVSKAAGQTIQSHMIVDGETSYIWSDLAAQGIKMSLSKMSEQGTAGSSQNQGVDVNQNLNYSCTGWSADGSVFSLPANITFSDFGSVQTSGGAATGGSSKNAQCSACDQVPDASAKAQCKAALGC